MGEKRASEETREEEGGARKMTELNRTEDELESAAIHEAGHAVLAELFSLNPVSVTIEPTDKTYGHLSRRGRGCGPHMRWRDLLVICGGCVAQDFGAFDPTEDLEFSDPVTSQTVR